MKTCETCRYFSTKVQTKVLSDIGFQEHICLKSLDMSCGVYGQDGRAIMVTKDFGCIHWKEKNK